MTEPKRQISKMGEMWFSRLLVCSRSDRTPVVPCGGRRDSPQSAADGGTSESGLPAGAKADSNRGPSRDRLGFPGGIGEKVGLRSVVSLTWDVGFESALLQR